MEHRPTYHEGRVTVELLHPEVFLRERGHLARDFGVAAIAALQQARLTFTTPQGAELYRLPVPEPLVVAETFAGTGIRSFRYFLEVGGVAEALLNDISTPALETARHNAARLGLDRRIRFYHMEANNFHYTLKLEELFPHVLDLDAFGSPVPFLDSAFHAVRDGGFLYITATDLAALCGIDRRSAFNHYAALTVQTEFCHETGARVFVRTVVRAGARRKFRVIPLFTLFDGYALRGFFFTIHGRYDLDPRSEGFLGICPACHTVWSVPFSGKDLCNRCPRCGEEAWMAGPLWLWDLHHPGFLEAMETAGRSLGTLSRRFFRVIRRMREEVGLPPFFYTTTAVADRLDLSQPPLAEVLEALRQRGYAARRTHFHGTGFKTTAPYAEVAEVFRQLVRPA